MCDNRTIWTSEVSIKKDKCLPPCTCYKGHLHPIENRNISSNYTANSGGGGFWAISLNHILLSAKDVRPLILDSCPEDE